MSGTGVRNHTISNHHIEHMCPNSNFLYSLIMNALHCHQRAGFSRLNMLKKQLKTQGKHSNYWLMCNYSTVVGVRCRDGIVIGTEKIVVNKMMLPGTDKRIFTINTNVGCVRSLS